MRVVLDTNVLVSAIIRDRDPEAVVLYVAAAPGVEWMATPRVLDEYRAVLRRPKFRLAPGQIETWERMIGNAVLLVDTVPSVAWTGDPGDAMFVACAAGVDADFLVTGDRGLLGAGRIGRTLIVTVSQFKRLLTDRSG